MNNYSLLTTAQPEKISLRKSVQKFFPFLKEQKKSMIIATLGAFLTSGLNLLAPILIGYSVDNFIQAGEYSGVLFYASIIFVLYLSALVTSYFQTLMMGRVGQNVLFHLRNAVFTKIQDLPVAFFVQNKTGDLISRINNDTEKLNLFFSQSLVQFVTNIITILGAVIFVLIINWKMGIIALVPAIFLLLFTQLLSAWIKRKNALDLKNVGGMSAEISESIDNFKVVVAFNRRDYFLERFQTANETNYKSAIGAGIANNTLTPTYGFASNTALLLVIVFGLTFVASGDFTLGLLISFVTYISKIYDPLRQMAALWSSFQTAFASWDRIYAILKLDSDLVKNQSLDIAKTKHVLEFRDVCFSYPTGKEVLHTISLAFEYGKKYALVGPTGGGKTTTASLIARLYDPSAGNVFLDGKDIRTYDDAERAQKIGFILQEPFLFTGTVRDNLVYGNAEFAHLETKELNRVIHKYGLEPILKRFKDGLDTEITATGSKLSLGQKQLIAFVRAILRRPELIILDEATANIDTVTEKLLEDILKKLPPETTLVVIAHRLSTIENADEIFFVNSGKIIRAGSMQDAVNMLLHGKRKS